MLKIYFAPVPDAPPERFTARGRRPARESAAAWSLLKYALGEFGVSEMPDFAVTPAGAPYFPGREELRFSLSHTRGYVLCALGGSPVGADVQLISPKDEPFASRLMSPREREDFSIHELWCLRESVYKLTGAGSLKNMPFRREGGRIVPPEAGLVCRLYTDVPGCAAAAAAYEGEVLPQRLVPVSGGELLM